MIVVTCGKDTGRINPAEQTHRQQGGNMPEQQTPKPTGPYLKNAWAKKDAVGDYWLFIEGGDLKAVFCLSHRYRTDPVSGQTIDDENSIPRRALAAWLSDQESSNGRTESDFRGS